MLCGQPGTGRRVFFHDRLISPGRPHMFRRTAIGALGAGLLALGATAPAQAATFAVNNNASAGAGSLRAAITAANGTAAPDTIAFAIHGNGVHTITPSFALPQITQPVSIQGYTQPGSSVAAAG